MHLDKSVNQKPLRSVTFRQYLVYSVVYIIHNLQIVFHLGHVALGLLDGQVKDGHEHD